MISEYDIITQDGDSEDSDGNNKTKVIAGIVFNDGFDYVDGKLPNLDYKIRMNSRDTQDLTQFLFLPYGGGGGPGPNDKNWSKCL